MNEPTSSWPSYELPEPEFVHAIGVVALNFNALEGSLKLLYKIYVDLPDRAQALLFAKQDNTARLPLLEACCLDGGHSEEIKESVQHFISCYRACAENRNILMHTRLIAFESPPPNRRQQMVWLSKNPKSAPLNENYYQPSLSDIRRIADEINDLVAFALQVITFIGEKDGLPWLSVYLIGLPRNVSLPNKSNVPDILRPLSP
jgi:hypothetical protein